MGGDNIDYMADEIAAEIKDSIFDGEFWNTSTESGLKDVVKDLLAQFGYSKSSVLDVISSIIFLTKGEYGD